MRLKVKVRREAEKDMKETSGGCVVLERALCQ